MAIHSELDLRLRKSVGASGFTQSGVTATVTGSLDMRQLEELINSAQALAHKVEVQSGVVKVFPR